MSKWIRVGTGHLWHRVSEIERADAVERGEYRCICGERIPTTGWQDAVDEDVPPDDQHGPCRDRSLREAHWSGRIVGGELTSQVRAMALQADPSLESVNIFPRRAGNLWVFELRAANLDSVLAGGGRSPAEAVGELVAVVEARHVGQ